MHDVHHQDGDVAQRAAPVPQVTAQTDRQTVRRLTEDRLGTAGEDGRTLPEGLVSRCVDDQHAGDLNDLFVELHKHLQLETATVNTDCTYLSE